MFYIELTSCLDWLIDISDDLHFYWYYLIDEQYDCKAFNPSSCVKDLL